MDDRRFYVYVHMKATDESVFYVGKGCGPRYKVKHGRNQYWQRIVAKYGYIAEIVLSNLSFEEANQQEIRLIKELKEQGCKLCNLTDGGEGAKGWKKTPEQIEHHKKVTTGLKRSEESKAKMKGRTFTEEAKARIGAAQKGKQVSEETRKRMSEAAKKRQGRFMSEESKKKLGESQKKAWIARKMMQTVVETAKSTKEPTNAR